jgi:ferritin-like metal-binding protein YciE
MRIQSIEQLFMFEVAKMLDAEHLILGRLQMMAREVDHSALKHALTRHQTQTEEQIKHLNKIFDAYGLEPQRIPSKTFHTLNMEYQDLLLSLGDPEFKELVTALTAEKVEHYEIAAYRGLLTLAQELGKPDFVDLIKINLGQEQRMAKAMEEFATKLIPANV